MKFKISSPDDIGAALKEAMSDFSFAFEGELESSMASVSQQAYDKAKELAASRLFRTKQQYIDALSLEKVGPNVFAVRLDASAVHLEDGYDRFDMKPGLLHKGAELAGNKKNGIRVSKEGYRYRAIPMEPNGAAANSSHPLNGAQMRIGKPDQQSLGSFGAEFNALKKWANKLNKATQPAGQTGRAWTVNQDKLNKHTMVATMGDGQQFRKDFGREMSGHLNGLTNVRSQHESGKGVRSAYMTFRIVSDNPKYAGKWWHPGFEGAHIMEEVQKWTEDQFARMVDEIFRKAA